MKKLALLPFIIACFLYSCANPGDGTTIPENPNNPSTPPIQSPTALDKWTAAPAVINSGNYLGGSVAVSGDGLTVVAGNYRDDYDEGGSIVEYHPATVIRRNGSGWSTYQIQPADTTLNLSEVNFGYSVAVSRTGDVVAVGSRRDGGMYTIPTTTNTEYLNTGAVYIFRWNGSGYAQSEKILPPILNSEYPQHNLHFGNGVDLSGDGNTLVVGAPKFDIDDDYTQNNGISVGKIYVFTYDSTSWSGIGIRAENSPSHHPEYNFFGFSVAISANGNRIVAGARKDSGDGVAGDSTYVSGAGSAYILTYDGTAWNQVKIFAPDRTPDDYFGHRVDISGDGNSVAIGSYRANAKGPESGSVYMFTRTGTYIAKLFSIYGSRYDHQGFNLAVSNDGSFVVVGYERDTQSSRYGKASVFSKDPGGDGNGSNPWTHENIFWDERYADGDTFGFAVGVSGDGNTVVIGMPSYTDPSSAGRILIYR